MKNLDLVDHKRAVLKLSVINCTSCSMVMTYERMVLTDPAEPQSISKIKYDTSQEHMSSIYTHAHSGDDLSLGEIRTFSKPGARTRLVFSLTAVWFGEGFGAAIHRRLSFTELRT